MRNTARRTVSPSGAEDTAPRLVAPDRSYAESYLEALHEGFRRGSQPVASPERIADIAEDFAGFLAELCDQSGAILLPNGDLVPKVPFDVHWLVAGPVFVGELSLRHELNEVLLQSGGHIGYGIRPAARGRGLGRSILRLGLLEAHALGLRRVLVTAHAENLPSRRVIEANGGQLENIVPDIFTGEPLCRYWIELRQGESGGP